MPMPTDISSNDKQPTANGQRSSANDSSANGQRPTAIDLYGRRHLKLFFSRIPSWLKNKYILTLLGFTIWMFFFDDRDVITTHFRHTRELDRLKKSKAYFEQQISETRLELEELKSGAATVEKYAREKYLMKRDNEDLFIIKSNEE